MTHHGESLQRLTGDGELVAQLKQDYTRARLDEPDRAMLDYVDKLTRAPWTATETDVEGLRAVGFEDRAILDIAQIAAYFAFVTRLAYGLGVTVENDG